MLCYPGEAANWNTFQAGIPTKYDRDLQGKS